MLNVYLDEEYGFREWIWFFPGSKEELVEEWRAGRRPLLWGIVLSDEKPYKGEIKEIYHQRNALWDGDLLKKWIQDGGDWCKWQACMGLTPFFVGDNQPVPGVGDYTQWDAQGHVHEEDDTFLSVWIDEVETRLEGSWVPRKAEESHG